MRQLFEAYAGDKILAALLRELPWTSNVLILGRCKTKEERAFYVRMAVEQNWSSRGLERQIEGALFERSLSNKSALSPVLRAKHPDAATIFKDRYMLEFLQVIRSFSFNSVWGFRDHNAHGSSTIFSNSWPARWIRRRWCRRSSRNEIWRP
jgi:predicted nuclease of restriction endonuclease-like (RecB) superfamily